MGWLLAALTITLGLVYILAGVFAQTPSGRTKSTSA